MRTLEEITAKIRSLDDGQDFFAVMRNDLVKFLPFELAKEFLRPEDRDESTWSFSPLDREHILLIMEGYMPFAWQKANNFRGLSAARTLDHYKAWIWLIEDTDKLPDLDHYEFYGKDHLVAICEHYGWDHSLWDDGVRMNFQPEGEYKLP